MKTVRGSTNDICSCPKWVKALGEGPLLDLARRSSLQLPTPRVRRDRLTTGGRAPRKSDMVIGRPVPQFILSSESESSSSDSEDDERTLVSTTPLPAPAPAPPEPPLWATTVGLDCFDDVDNSISLHFFVKVESGDTEPKVVTLCADGHGTVCLWNNRKQIKRETGLEFTDKLQLRKDKRWNRCSWFLRYRVKHSGSLVFRTLDADTNVWDVDTV